MQEKSKNSRGPKNDLHIICWKVSKFRGSGRLENQGVHILIQEQDV